MPSPQPLTLRQQRQADEWQACHAERARLAIRGNIGKDWDGKAANDNIAWPLAKALLAEGNKELLKYAIAYRRIYNTAKSEVVLGGSAPDLSELTLAHVVRAQEDGSVKVGKQVKAKKSEDDELPAKRAVTANDETSIRSSSVPKPWNGDAPVNAMIDAKTELRRIQLLIGAILDPFEMLVVDGFTLAEAGVAAHATARGAMSAGRSIAHMGLIAVRDALRGNEKEYLSV